MRQGWLPRFIIKKMTALIVTNPHCHMDIKSNTYRPFSRRGQLGIPAALPMWRWRNTARVCPRARAVVLAGNTRGRWHLSGTRRTRTRYRTWWGSSTWAGASQDLSFDTVINVHHYHTGWRIQSQNLYVGPAVWHTNKSNTIILKFGSVKIIFSLSLF